MTALLTRSLTYLTDYYGDGEVFTLGEDGARLLAAHLQSGGLPAEWTPLGGGFHGVSLPMADGATMHLGYDGDDLTASPGEAWMVAVVDSDGEADDALLVGSTLTLAVAYVVALG